MLRTIQEKQAYMSSNPNPSSPMQMLPGTILGALILGWPAYWNGYPLVLDLAA